MFVKRKLLRFLSSIIVVAVILLSASDESFADWINLTGAELSPTIAQIYIENDHINLVLEVGERDFETFEELAKLLVREKEGISSAESKKLMDGFFTSGIVIATESGDPLKGEVKVLEVRERVQRPSAYTKPPGGIQPSPFVIYAEIEYPLTTQPETITINPPKDKDGFTSATIGFVVYHKSIPVNDFRFLAPDLELNLNWDDPWYSKFENPNLKRHHSSSLMSFLYIEPFEVRHEVLVRLKDLENWIDLGFNDDDILNEGDKEEVKKALAKFFAGRNIVTIDGQLVKPIIDRVQFVKPNLTGIQIVEDSESVEYISSVLGVIISYTVPGIPQLVTVDWDMFTDKIDRIPANMIDPAGPFPYYLTPDDSILTWQNFLKNYKIPEVNEVKVDESLNKIRLPIGSGISLLALVAILWQIRVRSKQNKNSSVLKVMAIIAIVAAGALYPFAQVPISKPIAGSVSLSQDQANFILNNLLRNVYRAFDFKEEEDIYDKLAVSMNGDILSDIYLQTIKGLEIEKQGGARARVKDIEIIEVEGTPISGEAGIKFNVTWNVKGNVEHWGHKHNRVNQYKAVITVKSVDGAWKITDLDLIEEKRVQPI